MKTIRITNKQIKWICPHGIVILLKCTALHANHVYFPWKILGCKMFCHILITDNLIFVTATCKSNDITRCCRQTPVPFIVLSLVLKRRRDGWTRAHRKLINSHSTDACAPAGPKDSYYDIDKRTGTQPHSTLHVFTDVGHPSPIICQFE